MTHPFRIAVIIPNYGFIGGGEGFAHDLTEKLSDYPQFEIHVLANKWQSDNNKIIFHRIPILPFPKWLTVLSFALFIHYHLKRNEYDVIHSHERIFMADIFSVHSIPHEIWVYSVRRKKYPSLFDLATIWLEKKMYKNNRLKSILPVSTLSQALLQKSFDLEGKNVEVLPPGIDLKRFSAGEPERHFTKAELGISADNICILFAGMNFELKGLKQLIGAVGQIKNDEIRSSLRIVVAGKGKTEVFQNLADKLGLGGQLIFAGVRKDMEKMYQSCDFFVLPSGFDTFGMVVTEAMATSLPVIISDQVGAKDLIQHGVNGFICEQDDLSAISVCIEQLTNTERRKQMGQKAKQAVSQLAWDELAKKMADIYMETISKKCIKPSGSSC